MPWLFRDNIPIYFFEKGRPEKPLALYLHGYLGSSLTHWKNFLDDPLINDALHNVYMDIRGMGRNPPLNHVKIKDVLFDIHAMYEKISPQRPMWLLGYSLGSYLSLEYARLFPETIEGLILISPVFISPSCLSTRRYLEKILRLTPLRHKEDDKTQKDRNNEESEAVKLLGKQLFQFAWNSIKWYSRQRWYMYLDRLTTEKPHIKTRFMNIKKPIYMILGEKDSILGHKSFRYVYNYIPYKKVYVIKKGDHGLPIEFPYAIKKIILDIIREHTTKKELNGKKITDHDQKALTLHTN